MRILVLGGYGLIGSEICRSLIKADHEVVSLSRTPETARRLLPNVKWHLGDMRKMLKPGEWHEILKGVDVVINAASALQDGLMADLDAVHHLSIKACLIACEDGGILRFVQISSTGAEPNAPTAFMRTRAAGDDVVTDSAIEWVILRPGLVLAPSAYSGTALMRLLAAFPFIQPLVMADRQMQTVHIDELTEAALMAIEGRIPPNVDLDLVEEESHSFAELVAGLRKWLGFTPAFYSIKLGEKSRHFLSSIADGLGRLGWRSPLRSTALEVLEGHVIGDPSLWHSISGRHCSAFDETLSDIPSTTQERWFSKLALMMPVLVVCLSITWIISGLLTLCRVPAISDMVGNSQDLALLLLLLTILVAGVDIGLGLAVLFRKWARKACLYMVGMITVSVIMTYLLLPGLWIYPVSSMLQAIPVILLTLITRALLDKI